MFSIGEFSKLAKTTIKTLRFYDEIDLFKPSHIEDNGYRYYSIADLNKLSMILELREVGLSINDIKTVLNGAELKSVLGKRASEIEKEIEKNHNDISLIKNILSRIDKGESVMEKYQAREITVPEFNVYYKHGVIENISKLVDFVLSAGAECSENNPNLKCVGYCYITYEAPGYQEENVELEYVEAVEELGNESENIKFKISPEIHAIAVTHKGTYSKLSEAYAYAANYVKEKGYTISDKIREVYIHGCWDRENEEDYETEIQIPVK
ncbi:MAG: MerR family transcriptional regulator [Eubacteriales bacterium]|nr:MerR family transcriptional regulator [Eubacteriales bacterium]